MLNQKIKCPFNESKSWNKKSDIQTDWRYVLLIGVNLEKRNQISGQVYYMFKQRHNKSIHIYKIS